MLGDRRVEHRRIYRLATRNQPADLGRRAHGLVGMPHDATVRRQRVRERLGLAVGAESRQDVHVERKRPQPAVLGKRTLERF